MASSGKCPVFLAFGSLALAVAAETVKPGSGVIIATSCKWLSGMLGKQVQTWISGLFPKPTPATEEIFRNHDILNLLQSAIIHAVAATCEAYHEDKGNAPDHLRAAGPLLAKELEKAITSQNHPLSALREFDITKLLDAFMKEKGNVPLLTVEEWLPAIALIPDLEENERRSLAQGLATRFGPALWGCTKHDAEDDGKAFASIELLYLSEIKQLLLDKTNPSPPPGLETVLDSRILDLLGTLREENAGAHRTTHGKLDEVLGNQKLAIDPAAATARLRKEIEDTAARKLAELKAASAPVAEIANIHTIRDKQLADLDELVARLTRDYKSGDTTPIYQEALEILLRKENGGIENALEYLQLRARDIRENIAASSRKLAHAKEHATTAEEDLARQLQPLLYQAQLLEQKLDYQAALAILREAASLAPNSGHALNGLGVLCHTLALHTEAETALTAAMDLAEGTENEAAALNNLAQLLQATKCPAEAESLIGRTVVIFLRFTGATGHNHPHLKAALGNYMSLLRKMGIVNPEFSGRLDALRTEAGWELEEWKVKLKELLDDM